MDPRDADGLKCIADDAERRILHQLITNYGETERALSLKAKQSCTVFTIDLQLCGIDRNKEVISPGASVKFQTLTLASS